MKQIAAATIATMLAGCATSSLEGFFGGGTSSKAERAELLAQDQRRQATLKNFASLAAQSDVDGLMNLVSPAVKAAVGEQEIRSTMTDKVIPFFADYEALAGPAGLGPADFPDGRKGAAYYLYTRTKAGARRPFVVSLVDEGMQSLIADVGVNRCFPDRHPVCIGTDGSDVLRRDVTTTVMQWDGAQDRECALRAIASTEFVGLFDDANSSGLDRVQRAAAQQGKPGAPIGVERWTVNRCGKFAAYRVTFVPGPQGGTFFVVQAE